MVKNVLRRGAQCAKRGRVDVVGFRLAGMRQIDFAAAVSEFFEMELGDVFDLRPQGIACSEGEQRNAVAISFAAADGDLVAVDVLDAQSQAFHQAGRVGHDVLSTRGRAQSREG